ncbi:DUF6600 domain-containing protein, partial [Bifidobacterium pullorum]|uniref:DUF6600 domain-containing protein n=1 Tax=Bifidobacterium pullorum TaxID=78448 RepID=UPI001956A979
GGQWIRLPNGQCVYDSNADDNWEPYRNGYWYYSSVYGWTWQSLDPWGEYTDHYGVWRHYGSRWVWIRYDRDNYYYHSHGVTFFYDDYG